MASPHRPLDPASPAASMAGCTKPEEDHFGGFPGKLVRTGGAIEAIGSASLAPLAQCFCADAVAPGHGAAWFGGARDLGPDNGSGAGIRVDVEHGSPLS